jgi:single-stranded-DNA-specific exonuclease
MMELAELNPANLTEEHIGFVLGPRLNALGRLDDTNPIVDFLTTQDPLQARLFANQLEGLNARRQLLTDQVFQSTLDIIEREPRFLNYEVLILDHPAWPGGVVGIVASRLAERFSRPVILLTAPEDQPARGSARSIEGIDIIHAISQQSDLLHSFGGHPMAAGLSLDQERIEDFRGAISRSVAKQMADVSEPALSIDAFVPLAQVDFDFVDAVERLAPFGNGNPAPVLAAANVQIEGKRVIGRSEDHLILNLVDTQQKAHRVLWWNGAGLPMPNGEFDLAYSARRSDYRGQPQIQIEWVDWRQTKIHEPVDIRPEQLMEVADHRRENDPETHLSAILDIQPDIVVWREGTWMEKIAGVDRFGLYQAEALVVWTMPASLELLEQAIRIVKPTRVFLFAQNPGYASPREFSTGLTGLIKFALNQRDGRINMDELAAKIGHTRPTVETGLRWLAGRGEVTIEVEQQNIWRIGSGGEPREEAEKWAQVLESRLQETQAFRLHFLRVEHGYLLMA